MLPVVIVLLFPILGALLVGYLALRLVRAFERRSTSVGEMAELLARVHRHVHPSRSRLRHRVWEVLASSLHGAGTPKR